MTDTDSRTAVIDTDTTAPSPSAAQTYPPSAEFAANANLTAEAYQRAAADPEAFWAEQANRLTWATPFGRVLDWSDAPHARWFADGTLNVAENCVDRHVAQGRGATVAIHWEGEPGDTRTITYAQLQTEVCKTANALLSLGLKAGDRVVIYLPMIPEAVYAMLACARLGLAHGVVFAGFSSHALASRIADAEARVVITADGQYRRGSAVPLKAAVDEAVAADESPVEHVLVVRRTGIDITWTDKDLWWNELIDDQSDQHTPEAFPAEQPLFVLYTSGTTGKPKGIVHTSGGYLTQTAYTHHAVFDHKPGADVYWCTADIGWITGHSYIVYGPLANGATQVIYEGTPNTPHEGRHWEIIDKYKVSIYYTAPTLIRTFMKWGADIPAKYDLGSLRVLGSVGEPINPEAWMWYRETIGHNNCPIVDTWWQTETGGIMISPLPGRDHDQTRVGDDAGARHQRDRGQRRRTPRRQRGKRVPGHRQTLAGDAPHHLRRRRPVPGHLLVAIRRPGLLLRGGRRKVRRRRRVVAARPGRRRDECFRPPDLHHRSRIRSCLPLQCCRGRSGRSRRRHDRPGHRCLRHPA